MLHRPLFLAKQCPSSPGPEDDELPLVLVSVCSANCRVPQPDPNGAEVNAKNLIDFGSLLDQTPNTGKITTAVVLNRLLALQSISHKHLQWSLIHLNASFGCCFFFFFLFLESFSAQCDPQHQRATLPAVKPSTSHCQDRTV